MKSLTALESVAKMAEGWNEALDALAPIQVRTVDKAVDELVGSWREAGLDPETFALPIIFGMVQAVAFVAAAEAETEMSPLKALMQTIQPQWSASESTSIILALLCHRFIEGTLL